MRPYVTRLLEDGSFIFSETLQLVRACKRDKNLPSAFLKKVRGTWVVDGVCDFVKFSIKMYREIAKNHEKSTFWAFRPL